MKHFGFLFCLLCLGLVFGMGLHWHKVALPLYAQESSGEINLDQKKKEIDELQKKLEELQSQKQSLSQTISTLSTKIQLTESQVQKTEAEIELLSQQITALEGKIGVLNVNLERLSELMVNRVNSSYKQTVTKPPMLILFTDGLNDLLRRFKYLKVSQQHDREVIFALEEARTNYDAQKQVKEEKQEEVEVLQSKLLDQQNLLTKQQKEKQVALSVTRNDERNYQDQLARALAELEAIQSIIAGRGNETEVGKVEEGKTIASIIAGRSACSNGAHLHFEVAKNKQHLNPASYLSSREIVWDNAPDGAFGFSGSWRWPIDNPVRVTQGFGMTFYAATLRYYGGAPHTGIDMISSSGYNVYAVKPGTLYRGAIGCGGGTLRYVRVDHGEDLSTYYLHVNY